MRKITHLTKSYYPNKGGVERHVFEVNRGLVKRGEQVNVVTLGGEDLLDHEIINGVNVYRIPLIENQNKWQYKLHIWRWMWEHRDLFLDSDVIQVHDVFWWILPLYVLIWSKAYTTFHGWEGTYPVPIKNKLQRWIWAKLSRRTMHIGDWIREFYWDSPDVVRYGGAKKPEVASKQRVESKRDPSITVGMTTQSSQLVFIGRLEIENDIEVYLKLVERVKKQLPNVTILWVGDGSYRSECEKLGFVTGMVEDVNQYLETADIVLASSYLSIIEAQAMGKVVVAAYSHELKKRYLETYPGKGLIIGSTVDELVSRIYEHLNYQLPIANYQLSKKLTWEYVVEGYYYLWQ